MTTPERRSRKFARALGWLAAGSRSAYSNIQLSAQIEQEVSPFDARSLSRISHIAAARHDHMHMRVMGERRAPGVQH